jgi:tetratricopeptide (TPR) repeat protein
MKTLFRAGIPAPYWSDSITYGNPYGAGSLPGSCLHRGKSVNPVSKRLGILTRVVLVLTLCMGFTARGEEPVDLDGLFVLLGQAQDEVTARTIEDRIWSTWFDSGNPDVDMLMEKAMAQRGVYDFAGALETLDQVVEKAPAFAEAWNQRATIHFFREEYEQSLEAVARTLELEPRHFGAMAGRAVIRMRQLKPALARQNLLEALEINPWLRERAMFPDLVNPDGGSN